MIINGGPGGNAGFWAKHLLRDDTNERAEVKEIKGLLAQDLPSALKEMQAIAAQSRSHGNFLYQANINPREDEQLTPEQWKEAVDTLEKNLGLEGHQRVVVEHIKEGRQHYKEGRQHYHVVWNRVDVDSLRVADIGGNYRVHEATSRELEARFGLEPVLENSAKRKSALELHEIRAAEHSGIDPVALKAELTELWNKTDSGKAFAAAVEERGYILARGDRRDFCIVDPAGDAHSLARRLDDVRAKDVRERMADVDRGHLPSVAEARATQRSLEGGRLASEPGRAAAEAGAEIAIDGKQNAEFPRGRREPEESREAGRIDPIEAKDIAARPALAVVDSATGVATGLANFVGKLLGGERPGPAEFTADGQLEQMRANRRALAAIQRLRESLERGEGLKADDLQNLTPTHLENIRLRGDDYLRSLIESNDRAREHLLDYGRTRER